MTEALKAEFWEAVQHIGALDDPRAMEAIDATNECAKRIREWAEPSDDQLAEMFGEAGVPQ